MALPHAAAAQSPGCRASLNRALAAPRNQQLAALRRVLSNCPRDRVATTARQRIAELTRASPPSPPATDTPRRRTPAPTPTPRPRVDQPAPVRPPPAATATARGVTVANYCPYTLNIRLIYRTQQDWFVEEWEIGSGNEHNLVDTENRPLRVISDEIYYIATGPNGPLFADDSIPYELEGQTLFITPAVSSINDIGNYHLTMNCTPEEGQPAPAPAPATPPPADTEGRRYISFENGCDHAVRIYISHADGHRNWHAHGPFELQANQDPIRLEANGITLTQSANHDLYFYGESLDGSGVWDGADHTATYNGATYRMRRAEVEVLDNGWLNARLTCRS